MKKPLIYIFISIILIGCLNSEKEICKKGLPDRNYEFLDAIKRQSDFDYVKSITDLREFGLLSDYTWLRNTKNLKLFYASLKSVGLQKFISTDEFNKPLFTTHYAESSWENKSLNEITKNLIESYSDSTGFDKYYLEFWKRRKVEKNREVIYQILTDVRKTYTESETEIGWKSEPKMTSLLVFETQLKHSDSITYKEITKKYFNYLKSIELYSSASNLAHYMQEYHYMSESNISDFSSLIETIEIDSVQCREYWDWRYDAKWFTDIYDDGP